MIQTIIEKPLCAGNLVQSSSTNKLFVVTAAHCVERAIDQLNLVNLGVNYSYRRATD